MALRLEEHLRRLEEIVRRLESPDLPLEEALELYEEGVRLIRICEKSLREMRARVEVLLRTEEGFESLSLEEALRRNQT